VEEEELAGGGRSWDNSCRLNVNMPTEGRM